MRSRTCAVIVRTFSTISIRRCSPGGPAIDGAQRRRDRLHVVGDRRDLVGDVVDRRRLRAAQGHDALFLRNEHGALAVTGIELDVLLAEQPEVRHVARWRWCAEARRPSISIVTSAFPSGRSLMSVTFPLRTPAMRTADFVVEAGHGVEDGLHLARVLARATDLMSSIFRMKYPRIARTISMKMPTFAADDISNSLRAATDRSLPVSEHLKQQSKWQSDYVRVAAMDRSMNIAPMP